MSQETLLRELDDVMDAYLAGVASFDHLQSKLQTTMTLLEREPDGNTPATAVRAAEADLEEIRYLVCEQDQPGAVAPVLGRLRSALGGRQ